VIAAVLSGCLISAGSAIATELTQPLPLDNLDDQAQTVSLHPAPPRIHNPSLFLPVESQRLSQLVLRLSERRLYGLRGDRVVVTYPVAIGRDNWETPTGTFTIFQRQQYPAWEHPLTGQVVPPGPDNPLGARWLGFWSDGLNAIGFHGTPDEHLIGEAVSHGCVRLRDADVIELYDRVVMGTTVTVVP
jgi:lipoprotein-anchoring transpeptidase ErfK/SrfK